MPSKLLVRIVFVRNFGPADKYMDNMHDRKDVVSVNHIGVSLVVTCSIHRSHDPFVFMPRAAITAYRESLPSLLYPESFFIGLYVASRRCCATGDESLI